MLFGRMPFEHAVSLQGASLNHVILPICVKAHKLQQFIKMRPKWNDKRKVCLFTELRSSPQNTIISFPHTSPGTFYNISFPCSSPGTFSNISFPHTSPGIFSNVCFQHSSSSTFSNISFPRSSLGTFSNITSPRTSPGTLYDLSFSCSLPGTFSQH